MVPCLDCGQPATVRGRCRECERLRQATRYGARYQRERRQMRKAGTLCYYCGVRPATGFEHVFPASLANGFGPLRPCCIECNHNLRRGRTG